HRNHSITRPAHGSASSDILRPARRLTLDRRGTMVAASMVEYHVGLNALPSDIRPRERLQHSGPEGLSDHELLAIILRTGTRGANVLELASSLLARHKGLEGLSRAGIAEMCGQTGLGPAKAIQVQAAFELGRRMGQLKPVERPQVRSPADLARLLMGSM